VAFPSSQTPRHPREQRFRFAVFDDDGYFAPQLIEQLGWQVCATFQDHELGARLAGRVHVGTADEATIVPRDVTEDLRRFPG
jgi:hypothetical protein